MYSDYYWKNGRPQGIPKKAHDSAKEIKIIADPYFKHISIEEYVQGKFSRLIYDSRLLDFRTLRSELSPSWLKVEESPSQALIRDQNDRLTYIEHYIFEKNRCRECKVFSPHGFLLSIHRIYYTALSDKFNGVELFDATGKLVMRKTYSVNENGDFEELLEENWEISSQGLERRRRD